jgi:catechol 2,3-dioxygenase-like lactoylglutathione lyase family enzyme
VIDHVDLVVGDLERSLAFYRGLLAPLGYTRESPSATIESGPAGVRLLTRLLRGLLLRPRLRSSSRSSTSPDEHSAEGEGGEGADPLQDAGVGRGLLVFRQCGHRTH